MCRRLELLESDDGTGTMARVGYAICYAVCGTAWAATGPAIA